MKIKRSSWHYRLNEHMHSGEVSKSICGYFWQTIFSLSIGLFGIGALSVFGFLIFSPILQYVLPISLTPPNYDRVAHIIFYLELLIIGALGFGAIYSKSSFLQVIGAYLKAIKNKVCPLIKFED